MNKQKLYAEPSLTQMPWNEIPKSLVKIISRTIENLPILDFSIRPLNHWFSYFENAYDRHFFSHRLSKVAFVFNSCSQTFKQRLLVLDTGTLVK